MRDLARRRILPVSHEGRKKLSLLTIEIRSDGPRSLYMSTVEVKVPRLVESMQDAMLQSWKKNVGDAVKAGDILVELETDKVVLEIPAPSSGTLGSVIRQQGNAVHSGDLLATIEIETAREQRRVIPAKQLGRRESMSNLAESENVDGRIAGNRAFEFDVVVIGAGPGGYIAAIRAAQLGMSVACVEEWRNPAGKPKLGGTCLNVGCIPSKALLASSEHYEHALHELGEHGVGVGNVTLDLARLIARKEAIVERITGGVEFLFRKNKIKWIQGHGKLAGRESASTRVQVTGTDGVQNVIARNVVLATGSKARHPVGIEIDNRIVVDNEGALSFDSVPKKLAVIGAGVIGLELGSVWRRLGAEVVILEAMPTFLAGIDSSIAAEAAKHFRKQGLTVHLGATVKEVVAGQDSVSLTYIDKDGGTQTLQADRLIACVGRVPYTFDLDLESVGLKTDERGFIPVDEHCRTAVDGIYAVGDVVRGPMLAHKAEDEGVMVAELMAGQKPHIDYNCIPWVIYTDPEIAWVGKSEQQLASEGRPIKTGQFPMMANGRAMGMGKTAGFIKMIADAETDEILGVHVISANASDLIAEAVLAMEFRATSEDIGIISHPHPSLSEVMREAALAVRKRALNI
jgi:dihydrolipoamide dehydrogenase